MRGELKMAYNLVSSAACWMKSKIAGGLANSVMNKVNSNRLNTLDYSVDCSDWDGLEPLDLLRGWKGSERQAEETS